jgi:hypothetical protein
MNCIADNTGEALTFVCCDKCSSLFRFPPVSEAWAGMPANELTVRFEMGPAKLFRSYLRTADGNCQKGGLRDHHKVAKSDPATWPVLYRKNTQESATKSRRCRRVRLCNSKPHPFPNPKGPQAHSHFILESILHTVYFSATKKWPKFMSVRSQAERTISSAAKMRFTMKIQSARLF